MQDDKFADLLQSVRDMGKHARGEQVNGAREVEVTAIKAVRARIRLSQAQFAALIAVPVKTLQNWEQKRVRPTGPASALIHAINRDPEHVIPALQGHVQNKIREQRRTRTVAQYMPGRKSASVTRSLSKSASGRTSRKAASKR